MQKKGKCLIFGAANTEGPSCSVGRLPGITRKPGDLVIAADGGLKLLSQTGISPDIILGDFDSLGYVPSKGGFPQAVEILLHPVEKDDTDTGLAIKTALKRGYRHIELFGCLGGERFDHSIAALQSLSYAVGHASPADASCKDISSCRESRVFAAAYGDIGSDGKFPVVIALKNSSLELPPTLSGTISVFAADGVCRGVDLINLYYPLENHTLSPDFPLGVSNSFIDGQAASISVREGTLWIMLRSPERLFTE